MVDISTVNVIINQLITRGHHLVGIPICPLQGYQFHGGITEALEAWHGQMS